jgi:hypothetical protein
MARLNCFHKIKRTRSRRGTLAVGSRGARCGKSAPLLGGTALAVRALSSSPHHQEIPNLLRVFPGCVQQTGIEVADGNRRWLMASRDCNARTGALISRMPGNSTFQEFLQRHERFQRVAAWSRLGRGDVLISMRLRGLHCVLRFHGRMAGDRSNRELPQSCTSVHHFGQFCRACRQGIAGRLQYIV